LEISLASRNCLPLGLLYLWAWRSCFSVTFDYEEMPKVGHSDAIEQGASRIFAFFDKYSRGAAGN
jgi:hypothetical protein